MSFWRLFYHVVRATYHREAIIDEPRTDVIERSIRATRHELDTVVHAVGIMPDHLHLVVSIPPRYSISEVVKRTKGEGSHLLNHSAGGDDSNWFKWQPEYGVLSLGERSLTDVIDYVRNQRAHHATDSLWPTFEILDTAPERANASSGIGLSDLQVETW